MMSESEDKSYKKHQHGKVFKKRFNFKDRYKYNNNLSSNVSVRPSNSQILFYGNSAMEFRQSMERLESAFIQESCYELISNGNLVPDANGVYPENTFNEAEPIEPDYDTEILERSDIIRTNAERMIQYIQQLGNQMNAGRVLAAAVPPINAQQRRGGRGQAAPAVALAPAPVALPQVNQMVIEVDKRIFDIRVKCEEDVLINEQSRNTREQDWNRKHLNYMKKKKEFDEKVAKALKVFNERIGQKAHDHIKRHLRASPPQLRNAFNTLKHTYDLSHGGSDNAIEIINMIDAEKFNYPYQLAHQYASKIEDLAIRANEVEDGIIKPNMVMGYIIKGIEKNAEGIKEYILDIDDLRRNNRSLEEAKIMFQKHDSRLQVLRMSEKNKEKDKKIQLNILKKQDSKGKTPKSEIVCYNCNQKGHYSNECPEPKKNSSRSKVHFANDAGTVDNDASKTKSHAAPRNLNKFKQNDMYAERIHSTQKIDHLLVTICNELAVHLRLSDANSLDRAGGTEWSSVDPGQHSTEYSYNNYQLRNPTLSLTIKNVNVIMDSGASSSMFPSENAFRHLDYNNGIGSVMLGDNKLKLAIEGVGNSNLDILGRCYYVPRLSLGIISISQLTKHGDLTNIVSGGVSNIIDEYGQVVLSATEHDGLYYLDDYYCNILYGISNDTYMLHESHHTIIDSSHSQNDHGDDHLSSTNDDTRIDFINDTSNSMIVYNDDDIYNQNDYDYDIHTIIIDDNSTTDSVYSVKPNLGYGIAERLNALKRLKTSVYGSNILEQLHHKYGHMSAGAIKRAFKDKMIIHDKITYEDIKDLKLPICWQCLQGRMTASNKGPLSDRNYEIFEKIAVDYKDCSIKSKRGYKGIMLYSDRKSDYIHPILVKNKKNVIEQLDYINNMVKNKNKIWKILQSDSEWIFSKGPIKKWCKDNNVKLQLSLPYMHHQNGQVESDVKRLFDKARTLMHYPLKRVPPSLWCYAVEHAAYILNRSPNRKNALTPYEMINNIKPDMTNIVPFWSPGIYHVTKDERKGRVWSAKGISCRMLGYDNETKGGMKVINIKNYKVLVRKDVIFSEDITIEGMLRTNVFYDPNDPEEVELTDVKEDSEEDSDDDDDTVPGFIYDEDDDLYYHPTNPAQPNEDKEDIYDNETDRESVDNSEKSYFHDLLSYWIQECAYINMDTSISLPSDPKNTEEALAGPHREEWLKAIQKEIEVFRDRKIFRMAPQHGRAMKSKIILRYMFKNDFTIKYKARLVGCGYSQIHGLDYHETYAPTVNNVVVFILLQLIASRKLFAGSVDVSAAFLEGEQDNKLFAWLPAEICEDNIPLRVEVLRNWYGTKQASKVWYDKLNGILVNEMGFIRCPSMPCLYKKFIINGDYIIMCVHVDDSIVCSNLQEGLDYYMDEFSKHVKEAEMLKDYQKFLGMNLIMDIDNNCITVNHEQYIVDRYSTFNNKDAIRTPMLHTTNLRSAEPNPNNESLLPTTGALRFMADRARPDILVATGELSTGGAENPSDLHVKTAERTKQYLYNTRSIGLVLGGVAAIQPFAFVDASFISTGNCKSRLGGCIFINLFCAAIFCFSRNDKLVSKSSCESEIKALDMIVQEILYILELYMFLHVIIDEPIKIYIDNKAAIELCRTLRTESRTKIINTRINFIREQINKRIIELIFVRTDKNVADMFTKPLPNEKFEEHRDKVMNGFRGIHPIIDHEVIFPVNHIDIEYYID